MIRANAPSRRCKAPDGIGGLFARRKTADAIGGFTGASRAILVAVLCITIIANAAAAPPTSPAPTESFTPKLDSGVELGLAYLAKQQRPDGSFEGPGPKVAMAGLVLMSFLAAGHAPDLGLYGSTVRRAIDFLLEQAPDDGYFGKLDDGKMYGHGIVTLALAEAHGVEPDPQRRDRIRAALVKAVKVILDAQKVPKDPHHAGGWRYEPSSADSDLSLSGWNTLALRAAKNIGLDVPTEAVEKAVAYVLRCYHKDRRGFACEPGGEPTAGMTGVAVLNLYLLAGAERDEVKAGAAFLRERPVKDDSRFPYYSAYYATQAAYQAGGETWQVVWSSTQDWLLASQMPDGGWPQSRNGEEPGRTYATSMAVLTLAVPYRLLPIYQR